MKSKWAPTLVLGLSLSVTGCGDSSSENPGGTGGATAGGGSGGSTATGGSSSGGTAAGGASTGGAATGGASSGGAATGGGGTGGGDTGGASSGGSAGSAGAPDGSGGIAGASPGAAVPSSGCGVADGKATLTAGGSSVGGGLPTSTRLTISSGGSNRDYIIDIPADYDPDKPYRLIFSWHQAFGSANGNAVGQYPAFNGPNFDAQNYAFFGLHREATAANQPAIFVAPQGIGDFPWSYDRDVQLFDDLLARVTSNLCIDESRVFTTGFSFGAMMSHALSIGRASKLRGAVTMAPANYNFTQPPNQPESIAYFGITGMGDGTCRWVNDDGNQTGGKYCVLTHAQDNGCTIPGDIVTAMNGSNNHVCYDFEGCDEGYPVKVCTFDGGHTPSSISDGMSSGDDGRLAFIPPLAWQFISQF